MRRGRQSTFTKRQEAKESLVNLLTTMNPAITVLLGYSLHTQFNFVYDKSGAF